MVRPLTSLLLYLVFFGLLITELSGFAAWMKCERGLEENEIIMNNKVRGAPSHAEEPPPVRLAVYDSSGSIRVDVTVVVVPSSSKEYIDDGTRTQTQQIVWIDTPSDSSSTLSFVVRLDSETTGGMADVQYVVETSPFEGSKAVGAKTPTESSSGPQSRGGGPSSPSRRGIPPPTPSIPTVPSPENPVGAAESSFVGASGLGGGILCKGRRGHARGRNGSVKYELVPTRKEQHAERRDDDGGDGIVRQHDDDDDGGVLAEIIAGYSEYHGAVTLTPRVIFKRGETARTGSPSSTAGEGEL